jgi:hypothetical protein
LKRSFIDAKLVPWGDSDGLAGLVFIEENEFRLFAPADFPPGLWLLFGHVHEIAHFSFIVFRHEEQTHSSFFLLRSDSAGLLI